MVPLGYMYKRVASRPDWLKAPGVLDIYSLSGCVSHDFADYINYWKHNGYWLFDSPQIIEALAAENSISLEGTKLFYYEAHDQEYDEDERRWTSFEPESTFTTNVTSPVDHFLEGFDVASFTAHTSPECSPLSCNSCATLIPTNAHCLFSTIHQALSAVESNVFEGGEPGPYRVIAVYTIA